MSVKVFGILMAKGCSLIVSAWELMVTMDSARTEAGEKLGTEKSTLVSGGDGSLEGPVNLLS
jgi:hypothetical protein